jgi:biogenesis AIM24-like protein
MCFAGNHWQRGGRNDHTPDSRRRHAGGRRHRPSRRVRRGVEYDIESVGGIKTSLFGGEGLFFATLIGPGRVWLQTLPFSRLAERIHNAYRTDKEDVKRDFGGTLGAIGDLIGGE